MAITDVKEAEVLANKLADELIASLDQDMLTEAKTMGMAASMFAEQIESYRSQFDAEVDSAIAEQMIFDNAVSDRINN